MEEIKDIAIEVINTVNEMNEKIRPHLDTIYRCNLEIKSLEDLYKEKIRLLYAGKNASTLTTLGDNLDYPMLCMPEDELFKWLSDFKRVDEKIQYLLGIAEDVFLYPPKGSDYGKVIYKSINGHINDFSSNRASLATALSIMVSQGKAEKYRIKGTKNDFRFLRPLGGNLFHPDRIEEWLKELEIVRGKTVKSEQ
jgi:hypothetical protein